MTSIPTHDAAVEAEARNLASHNDFGFDLWPDHYREKARKALEAASPHMTDGMEWAVFRAQGGPDESPVENFRYKTRESAQAAIDSGYSQPQYWEPRGRVVGEWSK